MKGDILVTIIVIITMSFMFYAGYKRGFHDCAVQDIVRHNLEEIRRR
jgi:hypothetical protein